MSKANKLCEALPWVQFPLIASAPMSGFASSDLAVAVTRSGGLGQIGFPGSVRLLERELQVAKDQLADVMKQHNLETLPLGVGIIVPGGSPEAWAPAFAKFKPAMAWLSFGTSEEFSAWTSAIREASPKTQVWIQVGDVTSALEAAKACKPDALVLQGSDAGGHGHAMGASIVSLVPEVADKLDNDNTSLIAAGGIMDGRGIAAALALGASGVVMGTRFIGAKECQLENDMRNEVFAAQDGASATVRSRVFDEIWGPNPWPSRYDGRCLKNAMYGYRQEGMSTAEIQQQLQQDMANRQGHTRDFATIWAGTGVGLVSKMESAGDIMHNLQRDARKQLQRMAELTADNIRAA